MVANQAEEEAKKLVYALWKFTAKKDAAKRCAVMIIDRDIKKLANTFGYGELYLKKLTELKAIKEAINNL